MRRTIQKISEAKSFVYQAFFVFSIGCQNAKAYLRRAVFVCCQQSCGLSGRWETEGLCDEMRKMIARRVHW